MVGFLLLGGVNAVLYNITHYRLIQITSSTITPVIGELATAALPCERLLLSVCPVENTLHTLPTMCDLALSLPAEPAHLTDKALFGEGQFRRRHDWNLRWCCFYSALQALPRCIAQGRQLSLPNTPCVQGRNEGWDQ